MKRLALLALLLSFLLLFGVSVHASGDQQQLAIPHLVVNTSFLNARSGPGPQYTVITTLVGGTELPVLGTNSDNTWYLVTTAAGNAWVDVSFTLARGVFDYVPEIDVFAAAPVALTLPVTIGLPGSTSSAGVGNSLLGGQGGGGAAAGSPAVVSTANERYRAMLTVLSVDLRETPATGVLLTTMFRDDRVDYGVVGYTFVNGVQYVQISVPDVGIGWIEAPKVAVRLSGINHTIVVVTAGPVNLLTAPASGAAPYPPLFNGTEAFLINTNGAFYQVELGNGIIGWIPTSAVTIRTGTTSDLLRGSAPRQATSPAAPASTSLVPVAVLDPGHVVINTSYLNVRGGPGGQYASIAVIPGGTELPVVGVTEDGLWFLVRGSFGQGWVTEEFILFRGVFSAIPVINY